MLCSGIDVRFAASVKQDVGKVDMFVSIPNTLCFAGFDQEAAGCLIRQGQGGGSAD